MKKDFVKKLALGLAFSVAVGSVPATNVAAAKTTYPSFKSVTTKENRKELKVGQTKKYHTLDNEKWALKKVTVNNDERISAKRSRVKKFVKITGISAGKAHVRADFKNYKTKEVHKAYIYVEVKEAEKEPEEVVVSSVPEIKEFIATKANQLTATFASSVNTDDVTLAVTKGTNKVDATVAWNADKTVATITTTAKLTKGTYTLTATAKSDSVVKTANTSVEDQTVTDIIIKDTVALTGKYDIDGDTKADAAGEVYVYYDVVDQYGDSLKNSTSITWSTSCGNPARDDRNLGKLTLRRSDGKAFTFSEQIFITGVNTQTGKAVSATLTVGAEQALNAVEVKGFVKKNTTTILSTLPSGFKSEAYYMIYSVVDQNGNPMEADYFLNTGNQQVTLISDNVLVIKEFTEAGRLVTIDGVTYSAANVVPGMYVDKGGEVNITAIANKTGNKTTLNTVVGEFAILRSFVMSSPELIADGETVEIPFVATDTNGNEIKNFTVLADNINKLTFNASDNTTLTLKENNDGTATLLLADTSPTDRVWNTNSTDGVDRPVALTAIVVGGETSNLMVNIKDKARPDAIYSVNAAEAILEGATETIDFVGDGSTKHADFVYLDQYGRKIAKDYNYNDNGFFAYASTSGKLTGMAFSEYEFGVKVSYKGNANAVTSGGAINALAHDNEEVILSVGTNGDSATGADINAETKAITALTGENLKFELAKYKAGENWNAISAAKNATFAVVDITQVKNLDVVDLNKQHVVTSTSSNITGVDGGIGDGNINNVVTAGTPSTSHDQAVKVTGTFNGKTVVVPAEYCDATTMDGKISVNTGAAITATSLAKGAAVEITTVPGANLRNRDLYDATTAKFTRKDTKDTLEVKVNQLYANEDDDANGIKLGDAVAPKLYDTASEVVTVSDATPVPATIAAEDKVTFIPRYTSVTNLDPENWDNDNLYVLKVFDQYNVPIATTNTYKVSKVVENEAGYAENNFKVNNNGQTTATIDGAERGDTCVLTITATDANGNYVTKDVNVTLGADRKSAIVNSTNDYLDDLVKNYLEKQRVDGLK